jgi:hypothetical protein
MTQPTVSKRQNTATQMPAGKKPRFDLNMGFILCHDNPVFTLSNAHSFGVHQHLSNKEQGS